MSHSSVFTHDFSHVILWFQIPRTIVNVVQILPMKPLREVQSPVLGCDLQRSPEQFLLLLSKLSHSSQVKLKDVNITINYIKDIAQMTKPPGIVFG